MTRMRPFRLIALAAALALCSPGCNSETSTAPSSTTSGPVTVSLATPNLDDGALMIIVKGAGPPTITPVSGAYQVYWRLAEAGETRVIVVGDISAGPLFTATPPPGGSSSGISASVTEVATRANALRSSTAGYTLTVSR
jgi:hypothetical protein